MTARLACRWFGVDEVPVDAPVLVLGNSLGTNHGMWAGVLPELVGRFRVLAVETRGHRGSEVPPGPYTLDQIGGDFVALLDELGVATVRYAGLSLGGMIGMWLAAHVPDRIERLALVCTSPYMPPAEQWRERAAMVRSKGMSAVVEGTAGRWFTPGFREREPDRFRATMAMVENMPVEGYAGCCEAIGSMDLRDDLPRIGAPTLVVAGAQDPSTPPDHGAAIADAVRDGRLEVLADAAHMSAVEQPGQVAALLAGHLT